MLPYTGVGSGFVRVRELDDKIEVLNDEKRKEVIVTFWRESIRDGVIVTEQGNGVTKKSNQVSNDSVSDSVIESVREKRKLSGKEIDIINYCTVPRTSREILNRLGVTYHTKNIARYISSLVKEGLLKRTIPDKPKDRNQKYVKA